MSKVLAHKVAGREGMWTRVELDSGEVVLVSLANTIRVYALKRGFLRWSVGEVICEVDNVDAIGAARLQGNDPAQLGAELLAWATGAVMAMPSAAVIRVALPALVDSDSEASGKT